jgi:hypothetical protein
MFRFTIRDVLWLTVVVAMGIAWNIDRWRQNTSIQALKEISRIESISVFARDWQGIMAAVRNEKVILNARIDTLTHELRSRGHRVELDDCGKVVVDRPQGIVPVLPQGILPVMLLRQKTNPDTTNDQSAGEQAAFPDDN